MHATHILQSRTFIYSLFLLYYQLVADEETTIKEVKWGEFSMLEAKRRLLANALLDFRNHRFVLLSELCIPQFNFSTMYNLLIKSSKTFVEAYNAPGAVGRGRYTPRIRSLVRLSQWRKGSQWFQIDRALPVSIVSAIGSTFRCSKVLPASVLQWRALLADAATLLSIKFWRRNSNRTMTWVDLSKGGAAPSKFIRTDVTAEFLERLRHGGRT